MGVWLRRVGWRFCEKGRAEDLLNHIWEGWDEGLCSVSDFKCIQ